MEQKQEATTVYINSLVELRERGVSQFIGTTMDILQKYRPTGLYYLMSSMGGHVTPSLHLFNFLNSLQPRVTVTMHNVGSIESMAMMVFLSGGIRYAAPNTYFALHGLTSKIDGPISVAKFKEELSRLETMEKQVAWSISDRCSLSLDEIQQFFQQGAAIRVETALQKKIIHEVKTPLIPKGAIYLSIPD